MSKKSEDNIERFFRKAAGQYQDESTEFREDDWRMMEKMLDEQEDRATAASTKKWKIGGGIGAGVIVLVLSFYFLTNVSRQLDNNVTVAGEDRTASTASEEAAVKPEASSENLPEINDIRDLKEATNSGPVQEDINAYGKSDDRVKKNHAGSAGVLSVPANEKETSPAAKSSPDTKASGIKNKLFTAGATSDSNTEVSQDGAQEEPHIATRERVADRHSDELIGEGAVTDHNEAAIQEMAFYDQQSNATGTVNAQKIGDATDRVPQEDISQNSHEPTEESHAAARNESVNDKQYALPRDADRHKEANVHAGERRVEEVADVHVANEPNLTEPENKSGDGNTFFRDQASGELIQNNGSAEHRRTRTVADGTTMTNNADGTSDIEKLNETNNQESPHQDDTTKLHDKNWPSSKWSIALVAAPDFSSTGLGRFSTPGSAIGLAVQYQVLDRLAVSAGFIRTDKKYSASGDEYHPPQGYWARRTNGITPNRIDGTCMVLEIPFTLQYNLMEVEKNLLYVSAGVSSYLMQNQHYTYSFGSVNPGADTEWSTVDPSNYFFSVGTVAVGYERAVKPQLLIGIAPYLKAPFGGVGWPNVRLYTAGAYLMVRYRIMKSKISAVFD